RLETSIPTPDGVLVERVRDEQNPRGPGASEHFLVDPASRRVRKVDGDFTPLPYQSRHALQPAGADRVWVVRRERGMNSSVIGRYALRRFVFTPVMEVHHLPLLTDDIWVDERVATVYAAYRGHLIRFPLKP